MQRFFATMLFVFLGTFYATGAPSRAADLSTVWSAYEHAYATKSVDEMSSLFTKDAIVDIQGMQPLLGANAVRAFWVSRFAVASSERVRVSVASVSFDTDRGMAVVRGALNGYRIQGTIRKPFRARFLDVLRRAPVGTWHVFRSMTFLDK